MSCSKTKHLPKTHRSGGINAVTPWARCQPSLLKLWPNKLPLFSDFCGFYACPESKRRWWWCSDAAQPVIQPTMRPVSFYWLA
jgi:hypothetical protein